LQLRRISIPALVGEAGGDGLGSVGLDLPGVPASIDPEWDRPPEYITDDHVFDDQHHH